ncbi:MAG TPA: glycosyltransferase [Aggregatilineales bacterium]|jgi:MGT family glycosyltransferase|nr:glycosyltransferase [Aggregatilineales bacterium]
MPKALFFSVPAHGHINPSLPLVKELVGRGHEITYFTTEDYRPRIEATGAVVQIYTGIEDDYFDARGLDGSRPQKAALALLTTTKAILPGLLEAVAHAKPHYILYDCMCPWGYFIARIMELPAVSSASLMPLSPRSMLTWQALRLLLPMLAKDFRAGNEANRLSKALGKQFAVKPLTLMNILNAPGDLIISYSSAAYVPFADTLPDNVSLIGWTMPENHADEPFAHDSQRPLVYISLGTVINDNQDFYRLCISALGGMPYDVLITTGGRFSPEQFGTLPDNVSIRTWVPQGQVLKQASVFITHGGLNSIHEGLYCDLPLLVVPQQTEQTFNALRVVELGAGLMLKPDTLNAGNLRDAVTQLLADDRYRSQAKRIGETLRSAGGVTRAVDEIEHLLRR